MSSPAAKNVPPVKWAQRTDSLYVTISLADVKDHNIKLTNDKLTFTGVSNGKSYALDLEFFKEIESEGSIWNVLPQSIQMKLNKKEASDEFWIRLLKDKLLEKTNVTIDWDRYIDEDDDGGNFDTNNLEGGNDFGGGGMGGGMGGMGGMEGMGGMDIQKMLASMGGAGGMGGGGMGMGAPPGSFGDDGDDADSDDDEELPDLEASDAPDSEGA